MSAKRIALVGVGLLAVLASAYLATTTFIDSVEHPSYAIVQRDGRVELRAYEPMIVAQYVANGDRRRAVSSGFSPLAAYIFAKERTGRSISMTAPVTQTPREKIAMTAPVTQSRRDAEGEWLVRFVMPSKYAYRDLPKPANEGVQLIEVPAKRKAVIRFGGSASDETIRKQERQLRAWLAERNMKPAGPPIYAYYNSPFTIGFLRRNEIMLEVAG